MEGVLHLLSPCTNIVLIGYSIFSSIFTEYTTLTDHHMWLRGKADKNGYFTFQSRTSGLFLTAVNPFRTTIESKFGAAVAKKMHTPIT